MDGACKLYQQQLFQIKGFVSDQCEAESEYVLKRAKRGHPSGMVGCHFVVGCRRVRAEGLLRLFFKTMRSATGQKRFHRGREE